jgi:alkanesulfonate monooxygenase SsuD/methylene tetrahydromethanopterin reductase-like flavin-dependent oxidoreductase (luciferase family)
MAHNSGFDFASLPEKFTLGEAAELIEQAQASPSGWIHERLAEEGPDTVVELEEVMEAGRQSIGAGPSAIVGTPAQVCDRLEELHDLTGRRGGFMVTSPDFLPGSLTDIVELVVPELQRRGLYRTAYEGTTLRESFHGSAAPLG